MHASYDPRFLRRFDPEDFDAMFSSLLTARTSLHGNLLTNAGAGRGYFGIIAAKAPVWMYSRNCYCTWPHEALEDAGFSGVSTIRRLIRFFCVYIVPHRRLLQ